MQIYPVASDCALQNKIYHSKFKFTTTANSISLLQTHYGKFKFTPANSNSLGKYKFTAAISKSPPQFQIHHGKFNFIAANLDSSRQIQIHQSNFKFAKANSN